ncbi:MAG: hypothetical protein M3N98_12560, partial [Actinomycetota bacterium]|nr:hypothetical protein [Actinomycetota bacterium]
PGPPTSAGPVGPASPEGSGGPATPESAAGPASPDGPGRADSDSDSEPMDAPEPASSGVFDQSATVAYSNHESQETRHGGQ